MSETVASRDEKSPHAKWIGKYHPLPGLFDEFLDASGKPRGPYALLAQLLDQMGLAEFQRRGESCRRLVGENGVTFRVFGDAEGEERPWELDPLPLLFAPDEWRALEAGLIQRATLLNSILADCYGPQELIRSRTLPPALVFAQPAFLRPCHRVWAPDELYLHFYAADLARSPDGRWWVLADRTEVPTGAGYALANRLVSSRILPEPFRANHVRRLASFFRDVRNSLAQLASRHAEKARVVMLTPGPHNETYFEQAYLARYLGYMLVEGQDLTVRDDHVLLKTLGGLEPVDVILRRVDDDFCDPLELRNDSMLGVPGLLEAVRAGNVVVANAIGAGLAQTPALMGFLPGLCRQILGEDLKLPSVATWWCGQREAREHVLQHTDSLIVKPAFRPARESALPRNAADFEALKKQIEFDPDLFVAQEQFKYSAAPVWDNDALVARPVMLRVYLVATHSGYRVMPGGLARVSGGDGAAYMAMQRGGSSKDVWVLADGPAEEVTLLHGAGAHIELRRVGNNLPSRLADNFFWLGRYSERADATSRLIRTSLPRLAPARGTGSPSLVAPLLETLEREGQLPGFSDRPELLRNSEACEAELLAAIFDPTRVGSLRHTAAHLRRLATLVRDRTSNDMWRVLDQLDDRLSMPIARLGMLAGDAGGVLNETLISLAAFQGLARENMTRAQAWRFLDMGLRVERAAYVGALLEATLHAADAENPSLLEAVLEVVDSSITFRSRYPLLPSVPAVFDLVLLDDKNPRSVIFQLNQLAQHFEFLPPERQTISVSAREILVSCLDHLRATDARELAVPAAKWAGTDLARALHDILRALPEFSDAIAANYFAHSTISRTGRGNEPA